MKKKIYVEGSILIATPYFRHLNSVASVHRPPEDAKIIKEKELKNGALIVSENNPQSIFKEYYARDQFQVFHGAAEFLYNTFQDVYNDYCERIDDIKEIIELKVESSKHQEILNRMYYMSIVTSIDTFVSDIIVTKMIESEETFHKYYHNTSYLKNKRRNKLLENEELGKWEQQVIDSIMYRSYANIETIKNAFEDLFHVDLKGESSKFESYFHNRHLIAHKNGRMKDGSYLAISKSDLSTLISDSNEFVEEIMLAISKGNEDIHPC